MKSLRLAIVLYLLMWGAKSTASDLPIVDVGFVFEAAMYVGDRDLGEAGRAKVADAAIRAFVTEAGKPAHFPYLQWSKGDLGQKNRLTIVVTQHQEQRDQEVDLEY